MKRHYPYIISLLITFFCSCSSQKFIPEGEYLLDEVNITSDSKDMKPSLFVSYIRQNPNAKWFNLVKVPMHIYCASGQDSTQWLNRFLRKIGDAPVIYDQGLAEKSQQVIQQAVRNMGYMNAKVNLNKDIKKNKKVYLALSFFVILLFMFCYYEAVGAISMSFFDYTQDKPAWIWNNFAN